MKKVKAHNFSGTVVSVRSGGPHIVLELTGPAAIAEMAPGQFMMIVCDHPLHGMAPSPLIPRPFSVSDVWQEGNEAHFTILSKSIGRGTRWLAERNPGDAIQCFGPLGNGMVDPKRTRRTVILAGGGSGIAPLPLFTRRLVPEGKRVITVVGANVLADLPLELESVHRISGGEQKDSRYLRKTLEFLGAEYHGALMESQSGYKQGTAIDAVRDIMETGAHPAETTLIACGPWGMMRAAHELAESTGAECLVLLESMMACGIGVCRSCVCQGYRMDEKGGFSQETQNRTVCTDGPLFESREIVWEGRS